MGNLKSEIKDLKCRLKVIETELPHVIGDREYMSLVDLKDQIIHQLKEKEALLCHQ